ncbi:MAG: MFS transporter [Acidiferrobacterales bacterium]|nr:MFS transporter [Acidiferrobacterales bacterium]
MSNGFFKQKRFFPYFCTQFLGAFNDNVYKNALLIFITFRLVLENQGVLLNVAAIAFILPYFLFGSTAGQLADKYEKSLLISRIKVAEIIIMVLGSIAIYSGSVMFMLLVLFAMGTQSAFFGPIKYSILPQHLKQEELLTGNAYVEAGTFIAILLGTVLGGFLASEARYELLLLTCLVTIATIGWLFSKQIPSAMPSAPDLRINFNIWQSSKQIISKTRENKPVFLSILAISWFWFFGSIVLTQFPSFAEQVLYGDARVATITIAIFSIGIGLGSLACSLLSGGRVEIGLMPIGAIGISVFTWLLSNTTLPPTEDLRTLSQLIAVPGAWWVVLNMLMIAFSSGLFIVPMYTFMQVRSREENRSRTIAVNNIINAIFMVIAGILAAVMLASGFSVLEIFKVAALLNLIVTIYILSVIPEFFLRLVSWVLVHSVYRLYKSDLSHIPKTGPALLVSNHVSFIDPVLIFAVSSRPIRFVMHNSYYELPIAKLLFRALKAIPIAPRSESNELLEQAFDEIAAGLENGELICIFPEGGITQDGEMRQFQPGVEKIIKRTPVPVVPLAIRGLWGTWFSRHKGRAMQGFPTAFMRKLTIVSSEPIAAQDVNRYDLFDRVLSLLGDQK